jgi:hypothetical protein
VHREQRGIPRHCYSQPLQLLREPRRLVLLHVVLQRRV